MKSVQMRSYFWSLFSCIRTEYRKIETKNNSVFGLFSRSEKFSDSQSNTKNICEKFHGKILNGSQEIEVHVPEEASKCPEISPAERDMM